METIAILAAAGLGFLLACAVPHLVLRQARNDRLIRQRVRPAGPRRD
jgi:hypothetical protein